MTLQVEPIGYFHSQSSEKYSVLHQPNLTVNEGKILLNSHCNFEQALEGLDQFDRIWVLFWFHRNHHWKPKVLPPRGNKKQGVFATRSPHRPNFIGLSCVELKKVKGLILQIGNHDLIDGTPILDIKPYLNYADSFKAARQGWLEELENLPQFEIKWSKQAQSQFAFLVKHWDGAFLLQQTVTLRLQTNPFPYPNHRIKHLHHHHYELAYKSWRIHYEVNQTQIIIHAFLSGYDKATLIGEKSSRWQDLDLHRAFSEQFYCQI